MLLALLAFTATPVGEGKRGILSLRKSKHCVAALEDAIGGVSAAGLESKLAAVNRSLNYFNFRFY